MPNFADVTSMTIPEGEVIKITVDGTVLWEKVTTPTLPETDYSGEISCDNEDIIVLYVGERIEAEDYANLYIIRKSSTSSADIVYRVDNRKVTYGNGSTVSNGVDIEGVSEGGRYTDSLEINLDSGYFDGEYYWGFDMR